MFSGAKDGGIASAAFEGRRAEHERGLKQRFSCLRFHGCVTGVWRTAVVLLVLCTAVWTSTAQATSYVYDANGRLLLVTAPDGSVAQYTYDAVGNIIAIQHIAATQLSILIFQPQQGPAGIQVTITGAGFSATPGNNTVTFNGVTATVVSSNVNQIVAVVPNGATTGPISVKVGTLTAVSAGSFVVTGPIITSFIPAVGTSGTAVTVTGAGFDPVPGNTTATLGGVGVSFASISNAQFAFSVPAGAYSGPIQVITPDGQATSADNFIVVPSAIGAANVLSTATLSTTGPAGSLNVGQPNSYGVYTFTATAGQWLSVQLLHLSTSLSSVNYQVYSTSNNLISSGSVSLSNMSIHLPQIPTSGTYLVAFNSGTSNLTISATLEVNADLTVNGTTQSFASTSPGQSKRFLFAGTVGESLELFILGTNIVQTSGGYATVNIYDPNGTELTNPVCENTCQIELSSLPVTGTYSVIVQASGPAHVQSYSMQFAAALYDMAASTPLSLGTPINVATLSGGSSSVLTFSASAGQSLGLGITNLISNPDNNPLPDAQVDVFVPATGANLVTSVSCYGSSSGCEVSLPNLLYAGTYTAVVLPTGASTVSYTATLTQDITGSLSLGSPTPVSLTMAGQNALLSFTGAAGSAVGFQFTGVSTTPANNNVAVTVLNPDGTIFTAQPIPSGTGGGGMIVVPNISSGNYGVLIAPNYAATANLQIEPIAEVSGTLSVNGFNTNFSTGVAGEDVVATFSASAGENLGLGLTNITLSPSSVSTFQVTIYYPTGGILTSTVCSTANGGCEMSITTPAPGTYTMIVQPGGAATMSFTANLMDDVSSSLAAFTALNVDLSTPGQKALLNFTVSLGQAVDLVIGSISTSPANTPVAFDVYGPDGSLKAQAIESLNGVITFTNLSVGTYTLFVDPRYAATATMQVTFVPGGSPGVTGTLTVNGPAENFSTTVAGAFASLTFVSAGNQFLGIGLTNINMNPNVGPVLVKVFSPSGDEIENTVCISPGSGCALQIFDTVAGTYTVIIQPVVQATMSFTATLSSAVMDNVTVFAPQTLNLAVPGQWGIVSFFPEADVSYSVQISSLTSLPANAAVNVSTYIGGPPIATLTANGGSTVINLPIGYPVTSLFIDPLNAATASMQVTLLSTSTPPLTGTLTVDGTPFNVSTTTAGQYVSLSFSGNQGQSVEFEMMNLLENPGLGVTVNVYAPNGTSITSNWNCGAYLCQIPLVDLPEAGTYTVQILPAYETSTMSFTALMWPAVSGLLTTSTPFSLNIPNPGQNAVLTFAATAGQSYTIQSSGVATNPSGTPIYLEVDAPNGNTVDVANDDFDTGASLVVPEAVTGTYFVSIFPWTQFSNTPATASMQVQLIQNVIESLPNNGTPITLTTTTAGQSGVLTFSATAGQSWGLGITNLVFNPNSVTSATVTVYKPDGSNLLSFDCYAGLNVCSSINWDGFATDLRNLPQTGTYTIIITPDGPATMSFTATLSPVVTGALAVNTPFDLNLASPGQYAQLNFAATVGEQLVFQINGLMITPADASVGIAIKSPDGTSLVSGVFNITTNSILMTMPQTGTYNMTVEPDRIGFSYDFEATASMQVELISETAAALPTNDTPLNVVIASQVTNGTLTFSGAIGEDLQILITNFNFGCSGYPGATVTVYKPDGSEQSTLTLPSGYSYINYSFAIWLRNLSESGTYTIVFVPTLPCVVRFDALLLPDLTLPLPTTGAPVNAATTVPGQNVTLTFSGTTGQNLGLGLTSLVFNPSSVASALVYVYKPDGSQLSSTTTCNASTGCAISLKALSQTGTYKVIVSPNGVATMNLTASLSADVTATLAANTPLNLNLAYPGQEALLSFAVTTGQTITLSVSGIATIPANNTVYIYIYKPNGTLLTSASTTTSHTFSLGVLAAGTYTVFIDPTYPVTATMQVTLQVPDQTLSLPLNTATAFSTVSPGEVLTLTFSGTAGQNLGLGLTAWTLNPTSVTTASVSVKEPSGTVLTSGSCSTTNPGCELNLRNLPTTGTYKIVLTPGGAATMAFTAMLSTDVTHTLAFNTAYALSLPKAGQKGLMTFTVPTAQTLAVLVSGITTTPANNSVRLYIYNSAGATVASNTTTTGYTFVLTSLAAGTYTVFVDPLYAVTASMTVEVEPEYTSTITNGTAKTVSTTWPGQTATLTFSGTAGQNLGLGFTSWSFNPSSVTTATVAVHEPSGSTLTSVTCSTAHPGCELNLSNLPATGTYSILVTTSSTATMVFTAMLSTDVTHTLVLNTAYSLSLPKAGQKGLLAFTATAGETVAINITAVSTTPASNTVYLYVYNPSGTTLASGSTTTTYTFNLSSLAAGTYTLFVDPQYAVTATMTVEVVP